jgi:hypothetical protein
MAGLLELIDQEFAIYRHHHYTPPETSRLGWLRNMYYSLVQQLARQDPVWYAPKAAVRPDRGWRLISSPYTTKDTDSGGEATGYYRYYCGPYAASNSDLEFDLGLALLCPC